MPGRHAVTRVLLARPVRCAVTRVLLAMGVDPRAWEENPGRVRRGSVRGTTAGHRLSKHCVEHRALGPGECGGHVSWFR